MALRQTVSASATQRAARPSRSAVVVRASAAESRRAVLSGFAGTVALLAASAAKANTPIDLFDDRGARKKGFDLIYEARELDLPQNVRDGMTQARSDLAGTKQRVKESEKRLDSDVLPSINKAYWTEAREELRRQVGTLRFDLNTLASAKAGKEEKKAALALRKEFLAAVEDLDNALRLKKKDDALAKLPVAQAKLDNVLKAVL